MDIHIEPGKYIVAVSGGVDSVVLSDLLINYSKIQIPDSRFQFVVAHFDHGIRPDSEKDRVFVQDLAKKYDLPFEYEREELGKNASEDLARKRRYFFLNKIKSKYKADKIITAHHKDDVIETALINLYRGTNRLGLTSLANTDDISRPLLGYSKKEIIEYAKKNNLDWNEDPTNTDEKYLRNKIRKSLNDNENIKENLLKIILKTQTINDELDKLIAEIYSQIVDQKDQSLNRKLLMALPYKISLELLAFWLRRPNIELSNKKLNELVVFLKTSKNNSRFSLNKDIFAEIKDGNVSLITVKSV